MEHLKRRSSARTRMIAALFGVGTLFAIPIAPLSASPWVEVGDDVLRRDVEIVASYGLIDGLTTTWPIPWRQVSKVFSRIEGQNFPPVVRNAVSRLRARYRYETEPGRARFEARGQLASDPRLVRGFRDTARDEIDVEAGVEYMWNSTAIRLNAGGLTNFKFDDFSGNLDRSYIAQELGGWLLYAGTMEEWWGGGNLGSLIRSNNARPHPRIGLMRNDPKAFETPWLSWIGPWQFSMSLGLLDDDRTPEHPFIWDTRLTLAPIEGLEIGLMKTVVLCGEDMPCDGDVWWQALRGKASGEDPNDTLGGGNEANTLAGADIRYSIPIGDTIFAIYGQYVGEDSNNGWPGKASWLAGGSLAGYSTTMGADWQLIAEIADTRGRLNGGGTPKDNLTYDHSVHQEGYRYRGRTLGHSIDNQAVLYSLAGLLVDDDNRRWRAAFHRAELNQLDRPTGNTVTSSAENIHIAEFGVEIPWGRSLFALDFAVQDDEPDTPGENDWMVSAFGSWRVRF